MADADEVKFTFSWAALRLLGRGLYSNLWSALSELVANGFDAGATEVYVHINTGNKEKARIVVFDNGSGMSREDLNLYVKVGHDKRLEPGSTVHADHPMGRKGIGKLAALYLSPRFVIRTRRGSEDSSWLLDSSEETTAPEGVAAPQSPNQASSPEPDQTQTSEEEENFPRLKAVDNVPADVNLTRWEAFESGTFISLTDVDLRGHGKQSIAALSSRLANQFLLADPKEKRKIFLWVQNADQPESEPNFEEVAKNVAFNNLAFVSHNFSDSHQQPADLKSQNVKLVIPNKGGPNDLFETERESKQLVVRPDTKVEGWPDVVDKVDTDNATYLGIKYELTGWIGAHATIENDAAHENDVRFYKNRFYNPAQIRVYVRGKLASDRLLGQLGITGTYLNYIEGEISFDLLDDTKLPDIATSNRQDFDETDDRITLLRALIRPIVRGLMSERQSLADEMRDERDEEKDKKEAAGKKEFSDQLGRDLERYPDIAEDVRDEIQTLATNKIAGDIEAKSDYRLFISHASKDKRFADLICDLLTLRGVRKDEIFYTSRDGDVHQYADTRSLGKVIKESITRANTQIFYLTSRHFNESPYCLFEGGAGWATRSAGEYLKLNVEYDAIPDFLTDNRVELSLISNRSIDLRPDVHLYLVKVLLNPMIAHINAGRRIAGDELVELFTIPEIPPAVELKKLGATERDYYDADIAEHWDVLVNEGLSDYMIPYLAKIDKSNSQ